MQEGDIQALSALTRCLVDETYALLADFCQRVGNTILDAECYMVNALVALVEPLLNCAFR